MDAHRIASVEPPVDAGWRRHAASRRERGQRELGQIPELALGDLSLDLESDEEEEHGHQSVVDPENEWLREHERPEPDLDRRREDRLVKALGARVGQDERDSRCKHEQDAARRFEPQKVAECGGGSVARRPDGSER